MNFCPNCKREYTHQQMSDYQTGRCAVSGSTLV